MKKIVKVMAVILSFITVIGTITAIVIGTRDTRLQQRHEAALVKVEEMKQSHNFVSLGNGYYIDPVTEEIYLYAKAGDDAQYIPKEDLSLEDVSSREDYEKILYNNAYAISRSKLGKAVEIIAAVIVVIIMVAGLFFFFDCLR